ncbi:trypsin-2-like [Bombyx mandarina]|uniref:Trypsin-2-like n=1 Tax=Bombyx mandarina TaxID=7092 RepID=A0A6J2JQF7_BOMMA|nr:trypsin-2-like [Bombyx mandarina]
MITLNIIIVLLVMTSASAVKVGTFDLSRLVLNEELDEDESLLVDTADSRIVGGHETTIEDHPYQVSFIVNNSYFCGGIILSQDWIMTAAHCAQNVDPTTVVLRAGSTFRKNGTIIPIALVASHPEYDDPAFDKDVAVMKTVKPMEFGETMQPVALPALGAKLEPNSEIVVSGWGRTVQGAPTIPDRLMNVTLDVVSHFKCNLSYYLDLTDNMWCAGNFFLGGKGTCQGDSGGAAVQNGTVMGIVSFGRGCGQPLSPSVFAATYSPANWNFIKETTGLLH